MHSVSAGTGFWCTDLRPVYITLTRCSPICSLFIWAARTVWNSNSDGGKTKQAAESGSPAVASANFCSQKSDKEGKSAEVGVYRQPVLKSTMKMPNPIFLKVYKNVTCPFFPFVTFRETLNKCFNNTCFKASSAVTDVQQWSLSLTSYWSYSIDHCMTGSL